MKKYILFGYEGHDARGGLHDMRGFYDTLEEVEQKPKMEYWHVIDRDTWECVAGNDSP